MAVSGISSANIIAASQQAAETHGRHRHGHFARSNTDIDASGSSLTTAPTVTGKVGSKLDVKA